MCYFSLDNIFSNCLPYLPMHFGMYLSFIILHKVGRLLNDVLPYGLTCINRIHLFPFSIFVNFKYHVMKIVDDIQSDSEKWQLAN